MAVIAEIKVSVDIDKTVEELYEIGSLIEELKDLVPEWSQLEAEHIEDDIFRKLESLIMTRRVSRQQLRNQDAKPVFSHRHKGGGHYEILKYGKVIDTVRGKEKAKQFGPEIDKEDGDNQS